jgi:hypothetical protein
MSSKGPDSLWAAMSVYQSVIFTSRVGTRPQKNKSHPFFPNATCCCRFHAQCCSHSRRQSWASELCIEYKNNSIQLIGAHSHRDSTDQCNFVYWCRITGLGCTCSFRGCHSAPFCLVSLAVNPLLGLRGLSCCVGTYYWTCMKRNQ